MKLLSIPVALSALTLFSTTLAAPKPNAEPEFSTGIPVVDEHLRRKRQDLWSPSCTNETLKVRQDFDSMAPEDRKAYTDAIHCMRNLPSQLDPNEYPAATDRFMDYAVIHVNRTKVVHLDGFFLTWHRYFLWLFERDLHEMCGYNGSFPYWNWPATASNLTGSTIFNGDEYSMSGNGYYTGDQPLVLSPVFSIPHGSGGGCVMSGPFSNWTTTMALIPITVILEGLPLPETAFQLNESCLTRDLNEFAATTWCNETDVELALQATNVGEFGVQVNGVFGGTQLGLHSGAHFTMGAPASSLFVSPMDPIWYPLHTMLDRVYSSWQVRHPDIAYSVFGTETAANVPPSPNATLDSVHPDWGYLHTEPITIVELMSITEGPFCYTYDVML